ncbi:uncharacterized transporter slc-17.2-like isoform X2 [Cherax quadricarinatus]|uniref:uncharacterized transporter slc-17.2-like isoform X2 n=1 Tax=Cherax quadricarinatus TaxID=27406 RepID=UPI00387E424E
MVMLGTMQLMIVRMSLSMALVCMVAHSPEITLHETSILTQRGNFTTQGYELTTQGYDDLSTQGYDDLSTQGYDDLSTQGYDNLSTHWPSLTSNITSTAQRHSLNTCSSLVLQDMDSDPSPVQTQSGYFNWSKVVQGNLLSSIFCGNIAGTLLGGWVCDRWGGRLIMVLCVGMNALATLMFPLAADVHHSVLIALRVVQGFTEGMGLNAHPYLLTRWGTSQDLNLLTSLAYAGFPLGVMVSHPLISLLCLHGPLGGWPSIFYLMGVLGCAWTVAALFLLHNSPTTHPFLSQTEKRYFQQYEQEKSDGSRSWKKVPWKKLLGSTPVLALIATTIFSSFGYFTFTLHQPFFMRDIFAFSVGHNGIMSSLPWLVEVPLSLAVGMVIDALNFRHLPLTITKKVFNTLGLLLANLTPLVVVEAPCEWRWAAAMSLLLVVMGQCMLFVGGYQYTPIDLVPPYAATLSGLANSFNGLNGLVVPIVVAYLTPTGSRAEWRLVFWVSAVLSFLGILVFIIWGSAERLPWVPTTRSHSRDQKKRRDHQYK